MSIGSDPSAPSARRPRGRPRKTDEERDDGNRRRELLNAAARLFRRKGYDATRTRDIAEAVGMRSGSPFYHFRSKQLLLYAVMESGLHAALALQREGLAKGARTASPVDPVQVLRGLLRRHFDVLLGPGSDFIPVLLYEQRALTPRQRADLVALEQQYEALWAPALDALHAAGRLRGDPRLARLLIFGALNWAAKWYDRRKPATLDDLTGAAMALFVHDPPASGSTRARRHA